MAHPLRWMLLVVGLVGCGGRTGLEQPADAGSGDLGFVALDLQRGVDASPRVDDAAALDGAIASDGHSLDRRASDLPGPTIEFSGTWMQSTVGDCAGTDEWLELVGPPQGLATRTLVDRNSCGERMPNRVQQGSWDLNAGQTLMFVVMDSTERTVRMSVAALLGRQRS